MTDEPRKPVPPRIFRLSFTLADGRRYWRYIKAPYQTRSPEDWNDSLEGMQKALAEAVLAEKLVSFRISRVPSTSINQSVRNRMVRWSEIAGLVA